MSHGTPASWKFSRVLGFALCGLLALIVSFTFVETKPRPFSADYIFTDGQTSGTGKFYFSWPYTRMDSPGAFSITNYDTKITDIILRDKYEYMEHPTEYAFNAQNPCAKRPDLTCKRIGKATANGRECEKWDTVDTKGRPGSVCIDRELRFPISVHNGNGINFEYINIKAGPQPPSLFEIPPGYTKAF